MQDNIFTRGNDISSLAAIDITGEPGLIRKLIDDGTIDRIGAGVEGQLLIGKVTGNIMLSRGSSLEVSGDRQWLQPGDFVLAACVDGEWTAFVLPRGGAASVDRPGDSKITYGTDTPPGWIDTAVGQASRTGDTHLLYEAMCAPFIGWTIATGSPGIITATAHGRNNGDVVFFETANQIPGGYTQNTQYVVVVIDENTFSLNDGAGNPVTCSSTSKIGCKLRRCPYGISSNTTFNLPTSSPARLLLKL